MATPSRARLPASAALAFVLCGCGPTEPGTPVVVVTPPGPSGPDVAFVPREPDARRDVETTPKIVDPGPIAFRPWSTEVEEEARRRGVPLLVYVRADWAAPCLRLERETWTMPEVRSAASAFVPVIVDATEESVSTDELVSRMRVETMPCIKVVRVDGPASAPRLDVGRCLPTTFDANDLAKLLEEANTR